MDEDFILRIRNGKEGEYIFEQQAFPVKDGKIKVLLSGINFKNNLFVEDDDVKDEYKKNKISLKSGLLIFYQEEEERVVPRTLLKDNLPEVRIIKEMGKLLWNFIPEEIRNNLLHKVLKAKEANSLLRLRFSIESLELQELPWEAIYTDDTKYLIDQKNISISHLATVNESETKLAPMESLRILLIGSHYGDASRNLKPLDVNSLRKHISDIRENLRNVKGISPPEVLMGEELTCDKLKSVLGESEGWHVIHYIGHGYAEGNNPNSCGIVLKDGFFTAADFVDAVKNKDTRVVFTASCHTIGFGYGLGKAGIPCVISMRYKLSDRAAIEPVFEFYKFISKKVTVDEAIAVLRDSISNKSPRERFTPVYFLSSRDSDLFAHPDDILIGDYLEFLIKRYFYTTSFEKDYLMSDYITVNLQQKLRKNEVVRKDHYSLPDIESLHVKQEQNLEVKKVTVEEIKKKRKVAVIKGRPGIGKSTFLQNIVYREAIKLRSDNTGFNGKPIPVYISLKLWNEKFINFSDFIKKNLESLKKVQDGSDENINFGSRLLEKIERRSGKILLLLDGLNEVEYVGITNSIETFMAINGHRYNLIITSRSAGYEKITGVEYYELMEFGDKEIKEFVSKYFAENIDKYHSFLALLEDNNNSKMKLLASTPLLLHFMCNYHASSSDKDRKLPLSRVNLYKETISKILQYYLKQEEKRLKEDIPKLKRKYIEIIEKIAYNFFLEERQTFSDDDIALLFEIPEEKDISNELLLKCGIFNKISSNKYEFFHQTFQEYFTACAIADKVWFRITEKVIEKLAKEINADNLRDIKETLKNRLFLRENLINKLDKELLFTREEIKKVLKFSKTDYLATIENNLWNWEQWQEVILFLSDMPNKVKALVDMLLKYDDNRLFIESIIIPQKDRCPFRSMLFLSTLCCRESVDVDEETVKEVFERLKNIYEMDRNLSLYAILYLGELGRFENVEDYLINVIMKDENGWIRYAGVEALGRTCSDKAIDILIKALNDNFSVYEDDKFWEIRGNAADALVKIGNKAVEPLVKALRHSSSFVRRYAAHALGKIGDRKAIGPLKEALLSEEYVDYGDRSFIAKALGELEAKEIIEDLIKIFIESKVKPLRWFTAEALGELKAKEAITPLINVISNSDRSDMTLISFVIQALGKIKAEEAIEHLKKIIKEEIVENNEELKWHQGNVKEKAVEALGMIGGTEALQFLMTILVNEDYHVEMNVPKALAMIGDASLKPLIEKLEDKNFPDLSPVLKALKIIQPKESIDTLINALINALENKHWNISSHVASLLGKLKVKEAIKPLIKALEVKYDDGLVNSGAIYALGDLKAQEAVPLFIEILEDKEVRFKNARWSISYALGQIGAKESFPILGKILIEDEDVQVREWTIRALGLMAEKEAIEPLVKALKQEKNAGMRGRVAQSLGWIGKKEVIKPLIDALIDAGLVQISQNTINKLKDKINDIARLKLLINKKFSEKDLENKLKELKFKEDEIKQILNYVLNDEEENEYKQALMMAIANTLSKLRREEKVLNPISLIYTNLEIFLNSCVFGIGKFVGNFNRRFEV